MSSAVPPAEAAGPVSAGPTPQDISAWRAALAAWIERHRAYPEAARRRQEQGAALVRFSLDAGGRVLEASVLRASGAESLDQAALSMLRGATLPAPPPGTDPARRVVTVSIRYRLEDRPMRDDEDGAFRAR
ncbi:MAG TPA: energy transducer TonB [Acetobacteraceae bacterium]